MLDTLRPTATGLDRIPAWFLRLGAPVFAAPLARLHVPSVTCDGCRAAPVEDCRHHKIAAPASPSDFRPISITPVLPRFVVREFFYPALLQPCPSLDISDQFADTCQEEIDHIQTWAADNNVKLNRNKTKEIVSYRFERGRHRRRDRTLSV